MKFQNANIYGLHWTEILLERRILGNFRHNYLSSDPIKIQMNHSSKSEIRYPM